jgi:lipoprotein-anchoring transpeptidase ErfK/SrfK
MRRYDLLLLVLSSGCSGSEPEERHVLVSETAELGPRASGAKVEPAAVASPGPPGSAAPPPPQLDPCPAGLTCAFDHFSETTRISEVRVQKAARRMFLLEDGIVVRRYDVALGYGGLGPKKREGDGVTPTGVYRITGKLDETPWHTLLGVSYPNYDDVRRHAALKARGEIPHDAGIGFGIAVHGRKASQADGEHKKTDWTLGCIALDNDEVDELARVVRPGTPIVIED